MQPPLTPMPEATALELELLLARRRQLITMLVAEKNRLSGLVGPRRVARVVSSITRIIETLEKELKKLDDELKDKIEQSPLWRAKDELLRSVPGVGPGASQRTRLLGGSIMSARWGNSPTTGLRGDRLRGRLTQGRVAIQ
ncbi:hypothetical protein [Sorangium sp. So ce117]|uniref:hypothetical protein n=1 Tax=Sorangium sp. So ce117 TaxID=3133277 RepID=UPI003F5EDE10